MRADTFRELMDKVQGIEADDITKRAFMELIRATAVANGVTSLERDERVEFARHLLQDIRESRSTVRDRLMAAFGITESTAYRDIDKALQIVPKPEQIWDAGMGRS